MTDLFWLTDEQFARLAPLLPRDTRGVPRVDDRRVISGIVQVLLVWWVQPAERARRQARTRMIAVGVVSITLVTLFVAAGPTEPPSGMRPPAGGCNGSPARCHCLACSATKRSSR